MQWYRMDLHLHTPASKDYQLPDTSYLDVLQQAERRNLNIIAFTDHNTVRGYRALHEEIAQLEWLASTDRIRPEEQSRLNEYHRLLETVLVLPGFEFTATFGFHIIGVFSPETDTRHIEHLLLDLNIPPDALDDGETNVGASADVLAAYAGIRELGGIAIAAHANSSHGIAMRGMSFGGQTRIAYTQDLNLNALEVTDLDRRGGRSTAGFFDGSKPEYSRRMRCIQGSDAHRLERDPRNPKNLGIGERITEVELPELSFEALLDVFCGNDFARTRPYRGTTTAPYDHVLAARQEGASIVQSFHESMTQKGGKLYEVITDVCSFANGNGGTIFIGVSPTAGLKPAGVPDITQSVELLKAEIHRKITPPIDAGVDVLQTEGVSIIRVQVPPGVEPPYAIDDNKIYVRDDTETSLAVRDEIVQLVMRGLHLQNEIPGAAPAPEFTEPGVELPESSPAVPRTGVEIMTTEYRDNTLYYHLRDLRNGSVVRNVTRASARKLWHYAITQSEDHPVELNKLTWHGDVALIQSYSRAGRRRYDLAQRVDGEVHIYYGVTEDGLEDGAQTVWADVLGLEDEE